MEERYAPTGESMTTLLNFEQSCDLLALYLLRYSGGTYDSEYTSALYAILTADEQGKTVAAIWFEDDWDAWGDAPHEDVETFDLIALKDAYRAQGGTESTLTVRLGLSEGAPWFEYYLGDE
jgi:hypothetical protein